jgi:arylsulfatase A-like enzyme
LQAGIVPEWGGPLIAADRLTIGGLAKQHGYRTAAIGKWHLGSDWPVSKEQLVLLKGPEKPRKGDHKNDEATPDNSKYAPTSEQLAAWKSVFSKPITNGPGSRGFDTYFGTDVPNWPPYCFIENEHTVGIPSAFLAHKNLLNHLASKQGPALKDWKLEAILPTLADRASAFVKEAATNPEPFLLYLPLTSPHTPLAVNAEWQGKSGLNTYADFVMETDSVIGRVLDALEKSGAADKTLVVFTSDNGCAPYIGARDLEKMGHYPSGPLRGYKADAWEGGHRVPFIVRWPGVVKPGSQSDQLVQQSDLMATFAEILGAKLPSNVGEDSVSLLPILKGKEAPVRENAVNCSSGGVPSLRMGSWKYIAAPGSGGSGKGSDQSRPVQLYNLASDLGETKNLATEQPERVAQMQEMLEKLIKDGRSTPGEVQQNDVDVRRFPQQAAAKKENARVAK